MNSRQRAFLRSRAAGEEPRLQIGKQGVTAEVITSCEQYLEAHELLKGAVQNNSPENTRAVAEQLAVATKAEVIQVIGHRFVLYRYSEKVDKAGESLRPQLRSLQ